MESYFVLRNNQKSGPYSIWELEDHGLASTDLIWIEDESTSWKLPGEIDALKPIAEKGIIHPFPSPLPSLKQDESASALAAYHQAVANHHYADLPEHDDWSATNTGIALNAGRPRPTLHIGSIASSFFGLGVLLIGAMLTAFVVKKLVDHFEFEPQVSAQAIEIKQDLPASHTAYSAKANLSPTLPQLALAPTAIVKDTVRLKKAAENKIMAKAADPVSETEIIAANNSLQTAVEKTEEQPIESKEEPVAKKESPEPLPVLSKTAALQVTANDYKVGLFGGISELEITVSNPSTLAVEKAIVEVEYLKPNGNVVRSHTLTVENISPGGAKKVAVPSSNRGVKVRYRLGGVNVGG